MSLPLTVIIPANNEAEQLPATLRSVSWAAQVVVVDSFSTDATKTIAEAHGAVVWQHAYEGPAAQKNWAIPRAQHEWVFLLDADERVSPTLQSEIRSLLSSNSKTLADAYWIGRQNFFLGQRVRYSGWQNDRVVRLIRRDRCQYANTHVHEEIDLRGLTVGHLRGKLDHYTYRSFQHYVDRVRRYAELSALDYLPRTPRVGWFHLWLKPLFRFFKHFVLRGGILDGRVGFIISSLMAYGVFLRYVKILDLREYSGSEHVEREPTTSSRKL